MRLPIRPTVFIVLLLVAIFSGHIWGNSRNPDVPDATVYNNTETMLRAISKDVLAQIDKYTANTQVFYGENSAQGSGETIDGYDFKIDSRSAPTLNIWTTVSSETIPDDSYYPKQHGSDLYKITLQKLIGQYGFQESKDSIEEKANKPQSYTTLQPNMPDDIPDDITVAKSDVSCELTADSYSLSVTCTSPTIKKYLAQRMKPFVDQYTIGTKTWVKDVTAGPLVIKSEKTTSNQPIMGSETSGYDIAEMVIQMGTKRRVALFYANYNKNSQWHYVTEAPDEFGFPCTDIMKDPEARRALYDQICYDNTKGQVRVDSGRRALQ
jgi:hypothetical protein